MAEGHPRVAYACRWTVEKGHQEDDLVNVAASR